MDSDKEIESSVMNLNLTPSESDDLSDIESECDVPVCDDFMTFSNPLFDCYNDSTSSDDESFSNEDIDFLLEEFADERALINPILTGIAKTNFDPKEDIRLIKKLLYDNSSPHPPEELNSKISIKSFSLSPIPVEDSDSLMEEINTFLASDDTIPLGIDSDGYDSKEDNLFLEYKPDPGELTRVVVEGIFGEPRVRMPNVLPTHPTLCQDLDCTLSTDFSGSDLVVSFPSKNRKNYPLSSVLETLLPFSSEIEDKVFKPGIIVSKEEKSPHLLSHWGFKTLKISHNFFNKSSMMIYGGDIPIWDVTDINKKTKTRQKPDKIEHEIGKSVENQIRRAFQKSLIGKDPKGGDYLFDLSKPLLLITRGNRQRVPFEFFINNDLKYLQGGISTMTYTRLYPSTMAAKACNQDGGFIFYNAILAVTHVKVMRKHGYGYLEEIVLRRADNALYIFKEGDDVANFAIALRMFTRSLVIQKRVEDLQLGVESYQKKINVTKPDTTRPDLRKRHLLMRSDELYKFSDGMLTRLLSSLEDITKNFDLEYLPKRRWSNLEKKRAHFMIKDINKLLKERRMMRSLEKFVGCRLYGTDLRPFDESDTYVLERFDTSAGNPVKEILLKLNLPDHRSILTDLKEYLKMVMERQSVKVKEIQERCIIKAFQDYQIKRGMSMSIQKSQVYEMAKSTRWQNKIMLG
ncbi:hypothetical protein Tco_1220713 [Tanacetum coccineum]